MTHLIHIKNKKAYHEYLIDNTYIAGIVLSGTEIKSIRKGKASIRESYCQFKKEELFVVNMHIAEYKYGSRWNHEPKRERKLLLHKKELKKISTKVKEKGFTLIPISLFVTEKGLAKVEIALAKGKKLYDKRESLKRKDTDRENTKRIKL
jgi:SsrA-binding protein